MVIMTYMTEPLVEKVNGYQLEPVSDRYSFKKYTGCN